MTKTFVATGQAPTGQAPPQKETICYQCCRKGHVARQCSTAVQQDPNRIRFACHRCGGGGHPIKVCPTAPTSSSTEQKEVPWSQNLNYQWLKRCRHCQATNHILQDCTRSTTGRREQNVRALECPNKVPGLVSSMITILIFIDGVEMKACVDMVAAANV